MQNQMGISGSGQYEYSIDGSIPKQNAQLQIGKTPSQSSNQQANMPKRTPNSELNSY